MSVNKTNPFIGLSHIKEEEYASASAYDLLDLVEEKAPSYQKGGTRDMFLFLRFLNLLQKANVDFVVQGGIVLATVLGEHSRRTLDIDVIVKDPDRFFLDVQNAVASSASDLRFAVKYERKKAATEWYYKNTFCFRVDVYHEQTMMSAFLVDGVYAEDYDKIPKTKYAGPKIIDEDFYFYGVDIEYVTSVKLLAVSSELPRPVKHLVDLYSLIPLEQDLDKVRAFLAKGLARENLVRRRFGKPELAADYTIKDDKQFLGHYVYEVLSAGHALGFAAMKEAVNAWIKSAL